MWNAKNYKGFKDSLLKINLYYVALCGMYVLHTIFEQKRNYRAGILDTWKRVSCVVLAAAQRAHTLIRKRMPSSSSAGSTRFCSVLCVYSYLNWRLAHKSCYGARGGSTFIRSGQAKMSTAPNLWLWPAESRGVRTTGVCARCEEHRLL